MNAPPCSPALLFVTGTDTGVGKTQVACAITRMLVRAGHAVLPVKLIETGCVRIHGRLEPQDGRALARAASLEHLLDLVAPERFELPAAPSTAAKRAGVELRFADLQAHIARAHSVCPRILLEGAGGFLVPIGPEGSFADLALLLRPRLLVVARDALGTLNHTLLTVEAIRRRNLALAGVVLNAAGPTPPSSLDHERELKSLLPDVPIYGPLPWMPGASVDEFADALTNAGLGPAELLATGFSDTTSAAPAEA